MSGIIQATPVFIVLLLGCLAPVLPAQSPPPPQSPANVLVTVVVTEDNSPALGSTVTVHPIGAVEGWPRGKDKITLTTDLRGRASLRLSPGKYKVIAHHSLNIMLPADGWFVIKPGDRRPRKLYLNLLYWDCAHVTCML
jgi:hypothetical protein